MSILYDDPLLPVNGTLFASHTLGFRSLHHISYINFFMQDIIDGGICPVCGAVKTLVVFIIFAVYLLILRRTQDPFLVQKLCNRLFAVATHIQIEYFSHHPCCVLINNELVFVIGRFFISIACERPYKLP